MADFAITFIIHSGYRGLQAIAVSHWRKMPTRPDLILLMFRGLIGGIIAYFSFGGIILATMLDNVGQAAVLCETSVVFAAVIGWVLLKERVTFYIWRLWH